MIVTFSKIRVEPVEHSIPPPLKAELFATSAFRNLGVEPLSQLNPLPELFVIIRYRKLGPEPPQPIPRVPFVIVKPVKTAVASSSFTKVTTIPSWFPSITV